MLDNPNEVLYWCLRHGQRRQIAEEFGVLATAECGLDELHISRLWLQRLHDCGSIARAMSRVRQLHQAELRRIEDNIREYGARHWHDELENWRSHKYHLLELESRDAAASPA